MKHNRSNKASSRATSTRARNTSRVNRAVSSPSSTSTSILSQNMSSNMTSNTRAMSTASVRFASSSTSQSIIAEKSNPTMTATKRTFTTISSNTTTPTAYNLRRTASQTAVTSRRHIATTSHNITNTMATTAPAFTAAAAPMFMPETTMKVSPVTTTTPKRLLSTQFSNTSSPAMISSQHQQPRAFSSPVSIQQRFKSSPALATTTPTFTSSSSAALNLSMTMHQRLFATFKKVGMAPKQKAPEFVKKEKENKDEATKIPTLNDVMRNLYKKIHPDLMMNYPEQAEQNDKSLSILQSFLGGLRDSTGDEKYPMLRNASLVFFLRTNQPGHFQRVELLLHSDATLNKRAIEKQLITFFSSIGIASKFRWDDEYFPIKAPPSFAKKEQDDAGAGGEEEQYNSTDSNESYEDFMARLKREGKKSAQKQKQKASASASASASA